MSARLPRVINIAQHMLAMDTNAAATRHSAATEDLLLSPDANSKRGRVDADDSSDKSYSSSKKRLRVSRACDQCRKRKDRCDGHQPCCRPCMRANRVCSYYPSKKRGLRTGYVRSLEILLGLVLKSVTGSERWMLAAINGSGPLALGSLADEPDTPDVLFEAWRSSSVVKEVERLLCLAESAEDDDASPETLEAKLTLRVAKARAANADAVLSIVSDPNTVPIPILQTVQMPTQSLGPVMAETTLASIPQPMGPASTRTADLGDEMLPTGSAKPDSEPSPLPADWSNLLDIYFTNTHCWFPISQKHDLLRTAHVLAASDKNASSTSGPFPPPSLGDRAFLWAVLAFSHQQSRCLDSGTNRKSPPSPTAVESHRIYDEAYRFILDGDRVNHHQLGHVQALLLLALYHMDRRCWDTAWLFVGKAVYLAVYLAQVKLAPRQQEGQPSMLSPSPTHRISDSTRRVLLGCFVLETLVAARLGKRTYFRSTDVGQVGLLQVDSIEEWEQWRPNIGQSLNEDQQVFLRGIFGDQAPSFALSTFNQYVQLSGLLNDCMVQSTGSCCSRESHVHGLSQNLRGWQEQLSAHHPQSICSEYEPPQVLSLRLVSLSLTALIQTDKICLAGGINLDISGSRTLMGKLYEVCSVLEKRLQILGPHCIPQGIQGCLHILCQTLDRQAQCQGDLLLKRDMQAMRISLAGLDDLCYKLKQCQPAVAPVVHTASSAPDISRGIIPTNAQSQVSGRLGVHNSLLQNHANLHLTSGSLSEMYHFEHSADALTCSPHHPLHDLGGQPHRLDGNTSSSGLGPQDMDLTFFRRQSTQESLRQHRRRTASQQEQSSQSSATSQAEFQSTTSPSPFLQDIPYSSTGELLPNEADEDTLFDSLATLDSVEW